MSCTGKISPPPQFHDCCAFLTHSVLNVCATKSHIRVNNTSVHHILNLIVRSILYCKFSPMLWQTCFSLHFFCYRERVLAIFGLPSMFQTDNGSEFVNQVITNLVDQWPGTSKIIHSRPNHPQTNGVVERHNRTVKDLLRKR